jgi:hypothetical protein
VNRRQLAALTLLVLGAALFAIGTSVEKNRHHSEPAAATQVSESHTEGGESAEQHQAETSAGHSEASGEGKVLGIDRESTGLVVLAVLVALALAAALWKQPTRAVWLIVGLVALAFAVFDVAEIVHQLDESAPGLAAIAVAVALAHASTAGISAVELRSAT